MHAHFFIFIVALTSLASALTVDRRGAPKSYAALGDSYSAGIGAGNFTRGSADGRDNPCARTNGAYPFVLAKSLGLLSNGSAGNLKGEWEDFYSCAGDRLHQLDAQVKDLKSKKVDLITLSISGNDFLFGDVISACVFPYGLNDPEYYEQVCNQKLADSTNAIQNTTFWNSFLTKVDLLATNHLTKGGKLIITGYPRFFAPDAVEGDACDETYFLDNAFGRKLKMTLETRREMNKGVEEVNRRIESDIVARLMVKGVSFIDVDALYQGHRFCEPEKSANPKGSDPQDDTIWFNDINTELEEKAHWFMPPDFKEEDEGTPQDKIVQEADCGDMIAQVDDVVGDEKPEVESNEPGELISSLLGKFLPSDWEKYSVFHPKKAANFAVAEAIQAAIIQAQIDRQALLRSRISLWIFEQSWHRLTQLQQSISFVCDLYSSQMGKIYDMITSNHLQLF